MLVNLLDYILIENLTGESMLKSQGLNNDMTIRIRVMKVIFILQTSCWADWFSIEIYNLIRIKYYSIILSKN